MTIRTTLSLAAAAATFTMVSCDESGLPITQTVEGAKFTYVVPAGTEAKAAYTMERTAAVADVNAQMAALGIDNFVLESVEVTAAEISLVNAEGVAVDSEAYVSFADVEAFDVYLNDDKAANSAGAAAFLLGTLAPGTYAPTDIATQLQIGTGVNILKLLEQEEITARTEVKLREAVLLTEPLTVNVELDYEVVAKVQAGTDD